MGHAKAILSLTEAAKQHEVYADIVKRGLSVRQVEAFVSASTPLRRRRARAADPLTNRLEDELRRLMGTKVTLKSRKRGGRILIEYFSQEDLSRIVQLLGVSGL